jgi:hypothetical protein
MLFILAMEPLQRLFQIVSPAGVLSPIGNRIASLRVSLYADEATLFLKSVKEDVIVVAHILEIFGLASGLLTNRAKCAVYPIQCSEVDVEDVMEGFQCPVQEFPCKYLGLPLHFKQPRRVEVQPLIDKTANRLPAWRGRFLN